jgi:hypothetical protein
MLISRPLLLVAALLLPAAVAVAALFAAHAPEPYMVCCCGCSQPPGCNISLVAANRCLLTSELFLRQLVCMFSHCCWHWCSCQGEAARTRF